MAAFNSSHRRFRASLWLPLPILLTTQGFISGASGAGCVCQPWELLKQLPGWLRLITWAAAFRAGYLIPSVMHLVSPVAVFSWQANIYLIAIRNARPPFFLVSHLNRLAEIGDIRRFPNDSALAKYVGLTWRTHQSGEFTADDTPLTKTGNIYLRYYFVQAANSVRRLEPEYQQFYARKYRESTTQHHRRALVLTARKLVRLVDALLRSNQLYKPQGQRSGIA